MNKEANDINLAKTQERGRSDLNLADSMGSWLKLREYQRVCSKAPVFVLVTDTS